MRMPMPDERLVLDFVNTLVRDGDSLADASTAAAWWAEQSTAAPVRWRFSDDDLARLRSVRGLLGELFDARSPEALRRIDKLLGEQRLVPRLSDDGTVVVELDVADQGPGDVVVRLVTASLQVLCERRGLSTVRTCAAPDCVVRFSTPNGRRQWCSSGGCGNRARVRRHYQRRNTAPRE